MKKIGWCCFFFLLQLALKADQVSTECDTLFTTDGKQYLINVYHQNKQRLEFSMCGDTTDARFVLSMKQVRRVGIIASKIATPEDRLAKLARWAVLTTAVGCFALMMFYIPLWSFMGYLLLLFSLLTGEYILRGLKQQPDHPEYKSIRKKARFAVKASLVLLILATTIFWGNVFE